MKNFLEKTRAFFSSLASRIQRKPKVSAGTSATNEPPTSPRQKRKPDRFTLISWVVTLVIVVSLLGSTILYKNANASTSFQPQPTTAPGEVPPVLGLPVAGSDGSGFSSILRELKLKTDIPERARVEP